ncbi:hypothetical protein AGLY_005663 [Aphis glycines]|uniref:Uncharacterized protein n=1 Tax=Aphis glycines TaxID=307491 RepID=A0A6G0TTY2_APHGL|nr:hypothetical protein AGLY_005663 [Aphis glycines]
MLPAVNRVYYILFLHTIQLNHAPVGKFENSSVSISIYSFADKCFGAKKHEFSGKWAPGSYVLLCLCGLMDSKNSNLVADVVKWVPLCCTVDHNYLRIKFESNDRYHCIRKTILNRDDLSAQRIKFDIIGHRSSSFILIVSQAYGNCDFFLTTIRKIHKKSCIKFSSFFGQPKFFYRHFKKNVTLISNLSIQLLVFYKFTHPIIWNLSSSIYIFCIDPHVIICIRFFLLYRFNKPFILPLCLYFHRFLCNLLCRNLNQPLVKGILELTRQRILLST